MQGKTHYPFADIQNGISRKSTRSSYNERMNNGNSLSSCDYETTPKFKKNFGTNINAKFDIFMKTRCEFIIKAVMNCFRTGQENLRLYYIYFNNL